MLEFVYLDGVGNIVGKRRKWWLPAFSPFPTIVSKAMFLPYQRKTAQLEPHLNCLPQLL